MKPEQSQASLCHFPFSGTVVQTFYCRQQAGATLEDCLHHVWGEGRSLPALPLPPWIAKEIGLYRHNNKKNPETSNTNMNATIQINCWNSRLELVFFSKRDLKQ